MIEVKDADDGTRLDRWFKKYFPYIPHDRLQKLLRTGQIRVNGGRIKSAHRLNSGQNIRIPPLQKSDTSTPKLATTPIIKPGRKNELFQSIIYQDDDVMIVNKPSGLAVQGGTKTDEHLDGYLESLRFDNPERPRLVHRLDKNTSGAIVLARNTITARWLTKAFKEHDIRKLYWAVVSGVPKNATGTISNRLEKRRSKWGENVIIAKSPYGQSAETNYKIIAYTADPVTWLAMQPFTGRTHQLRVHVAKVLKTPILGDGKYGNESTFYRTHSISRELHLHARKVQVTGPNGRRIEAIAPLPNHMVSTFKYFGFEEESGEIGFLDT